jgi:quinol monooxygenase YgiN
MRTITAQFKILPGKEADAADVIKALVAGVDSEEPGAVAYAFHTHAKDPNSVFVFEIYRDDDAVRFHTSTAHYAEFQKAFGPVFDPASVKVDRYERLAAISR